MSEADRVRFARLCHEELLRDKERESIGLLAEKRLHAVLKRFVCDDFACHEQKVPQRDGKKRGFVADVLTPAGEIFEIQTAALYPLRRKITFYMQETACRVTVVHPLIAAKTICWMDPATGEVTARRRSPRHDTPLSFLGELKPYLPYLGSPRFAVWLPCVAAEEYRLLDGWARGGKRGSHRYELIPLELTNLFRLAAREDYAVLLPADLPAAFTAKTFGKTAKIGGYALYDALAVFEGLGAIEKCGKEGRAALYRTTVCSTE